MSLLAYRNVILGLMVFASLWIFFLFLSHVLLEFEQTKDFEERFLVRATTVRRLITETIPEDDGELLSGEYMTGHAGNRHTTKCRKELI